MKKKSIFSKYDEKRVFFWSMMRKEKNIEIKVKLHEFTKKYGSKHASSSFNTSWNLFNLNNDYIHIEFSRTDMHPRLNFSEIKKKKDRKN